MTTRPDPEVPPNDEIPAADAELDRNEEFLTLTADRFRHALHAWITEHVGELESELPEQELEAIEARLTELRPGPESEEPLAIDRVVARCGLDPLEEEILLLAAAGETSSPLRKLLGEWPGIPGYHPTLRVLQDLLSEQWGLPRVRRALAADAPLRCLTLLELIDHNESDDSTSATESEVLASDRVVRFLLGDQELAPSLRVYTRLLEPSVGFDELKMQRQPIEALRASLDAGDDRQQWWRPLVKPGPLLLLTVGLPGSGRGAVCEAVAHHLGLRVLEVDYQALGVEGSDFGYYLTRIFREATLQQALVVFVHCAQLQLGDDFDRTGFWLLCRRMERFPGPVALCLDKPLPFASFPPDRRIFRVDLEIPPAPYRRELWAQLLPKEGLAPDIDVWNLAKIFNFGGGAIQEMIREATNLVLTGEGPDGVLSSEHLMAAGRELQSRRMGKFTRKMIPRQSLADLIVQPRTLRGIEEIIHTVRYRHIVFQDWGFGEKISTGKGMAALFSGPPGTGKSMAAGVIARECGMNLFRVNLAAVVSKYVGETEERLQKVFEQARESHSILLFDEADALFAKRSKVKSSQDKYANLEVNFLLQEVEGFEGMVILTTNLESQIDKAFLRRLNFRIFFPKPEVEDRIRIWKAHIPARAPFAKDIDWRALAEDFDVTGGYIKNAIVRAAQWAAEKEGMITHEMLCRAAESEMSETGRVIRETHQS